MLVANRDKLAEKIQMGLKNVCLKFNKTKKEECIERINRAIFQMVHTTISELFERKQKAAPSYFDYQEPINSVKLAGTSGHSLLLMENTALAYQSTRRCELELEIPILLGNFISDQTMPIVVREHENRRVRISLLDLMSYMLEKNPQLAKSLIP